MAVTKIVVVAYHLGRVGSSAIMGLLGQGGLDVGRKEGLVPARAMNPRGFFELKEQHAFLKHVYPGVYPDVVDPPALQVLDAIGAKHHGAYRTMLDGAYTRGTPIAVKSQRFLTLPFLVRLDHLFQVRVLVLERDHMEQVRSTLRVWRGSKNPAQRDADEAFVSAYIRKWKEFCRSIEARYPLAYHHVSFNDLLRDPECVSARLFSFIGEPLPPREKILDWFAPELVNREVLS